MADIPLIVTSPVGSGTPAPTAANVSINPAITSLNLLNDTTIPAINTTVTAQGVSIGTLQTTVTTQGTSITTLNTEMTAVQSGLSTAETNITTLQADVAALSGGNFIVPQSYGTWDTTGATDVSATLQLAVNAACSLRLPLMIPPGIYKISNTVLLTSAMNATQSLIMIGVGPQPGSANTLTNSGHNPFTIFVSTITNGPCFEMTGGRNCALYNMTITGPNTIAQFQFPNYDPANYVNSGIRDSQYSPCCGISLDGLNSAVPSDGGFPNNAADGTTMVSKYSASHSGSSNILLDNVSICNFVVGIAVTLTGAGSLTDQLTMNRCNVTICKVAYACTQAQSKIHVINGGDWGSCQTLFDGASYGTQSGVPPINVMNLNIGNVLRVFNFSEQDGPVHFGPNYGESFRSWGVFGTASASSRAYLTIRGTPNTFFTGGAQGDQAPLPLPPVLLETFGTASRIESMSFGLNNGNAYSWNLVQDTSNNIFSPLVLENCIFKGPGTSGYLPPVAADHTFGSTAALVYCSETGLFPNYPMSDFSSSDISTFTRNGVAVMTPKSARYANGNSYVEYISPSVSSTLSASASSITLNTTSITFTSAPGLGATSATLTTGFSGNSGIYLVTFSNGNVRHTMLGNGSTSCSWFNNPLTAAATTAATVACTSLTFTAADATLFQVGDLLFWQMILQGCSQTKRTVLAWTVSNISGTTITALPTCDTTQYDTAANNPTSSVLIWQQQWCPSGASITATANATTTLSSVSSTGLYNGYWIQDSAGYLAANSRIVSGGNTATLVLNKAATGSGSTNLYFGRAEAPTLTAVW